MLKIQIFKPECQIFCLNQALNKLYVLFKKIIFLQACISFAYITIPSISNHYNQLQAHLLTAQVAYQCHCLGQAEANIEAIILLLKSMKENKIDDLSAILNNFIPSFMSFMLVIPITNRQSLREKNDFTDFTPFPFVSIGRSYFKSDF